MTASKHSSASKESVKVCRELFTSHDSDVIVDQIGVDLATHVGR